MSSTYEISKKKEELKRLINEKFEFNRSNNRVYLQGQIYEEIKFDHAIKSSLVKIFETRIAIRRLSGTYDFIPVFIPEYVLPRELKAKARGKYVRICGEYHSYNIIGDDGRIHLKLRVYVNKIEIIKKDEPMEDINIIYLRGELCKLPDFRKTPRGWDIADMHISVFGNKHKRNYIPCVAWYQNAWYAAQLKAWDSVEVYGRIQSREYFKKNSPDSEEGEYRTAYEVSIMEII